MWRAAGQRRAGSNQLVASSGCSLLRLLPLLRSGLVTHGAQRCVRGWVGGWACACVRACVCGWVGGWVPPLSCARASLAHPASARPPAPLPHPPCASPHPPTLRLAPPLLALLHPHLLHRPRSKVPARAAAKRQSQGGGWVGGWVGVGGWAGGVGWGACGGVRGVGLVGGRAHARGEQKADDAQRCHTHPSTRPTPPHTPPPMRPPRSHGGNGQQKVDEEQRCCRLFVRAHRAAHPRRPGGGGVGGAGGAWTQVCGCRWVGGRVQVGGWGMQAGKCRAGVRGSGAAAACAHRIWMSAITSAKKQMLPASTTAFQMNWRGWVGGGRVGGWVGAGG